MSKQTKVKENDNDHDEDDGRLPCCSHLAKIRWYNTGRHPAQDFSVQVTAETAFCSCKQRVQVVILSTSVQDRPWQSPPVADKRWFKRPVASCHLVRKRRRRRRRIETNRGRG